MKHLNNYTQEAQTRVFDKYGVFFAFSDSQYEEQKKDGVKYASLGSGLVVPKDNALEMMAALEKVQQEGITADIAENTIEGIIQRELANHECQITGDCDVVIELMKSYGASKADVMNQWTEFFQKCLDNDSF